MLVDLEQHLAQTLSCGAEVLARSRRDDKYCHMFDGPGGRHGIDSNHLKPVGFQKQKGEDGRASYNHLGRSTGVSPGTARTRVLRLIDDGVVRVGALTRPGSGKQEIPVGIGIRVRGRATAVSDELTNVPGMRFLAETLGRYDIVGTVHTTDLSTIVSILDHIRAMDPVLHVHSWVHLQTMKELYR